MARVEQVHLEVAVAVCLGAVDRAGFRMGDNDRDSGDHRLLRVNDFARNAAVQVLSDCGAGDRKQDRGHQEERLHNGLIVSRQTADPCRDESRRG
jgi:hypothetical protein